MILFFLFLLSCFHMAEAHLQPEKTIVSQCLQPCEGDPHPSGLPGVDALYVINLDQRPEKWSRMESHLAMHGLTSTRFPAINGWDMDDEVKSELMGPYIHRLTCGRIGCILSHLSVIKDAYDRGFHVIWVMEDDVIVVEETSQISSMIETVEELDPDWDLFFTDIDSKDPNGQRVPSRGLDVRPDQEHLPLEHYNQQILITSEIKKIGQRFGMYSYLVSRKGMKKILDYFTHVYLWSPWDVDVHYVPGIREYSATRDIVSICYEINISDTTRPLHPLVVDHWIESTAGRAPVADISEPR